MGIVLLENVLKKATCAYRTLSETRGLQQKRMTDALAKVSRHPTNKTYTQTMPETIYNFREMIKKFKQTVFNSLEENTDDKHNPKHYKQAIDRIFQLGIILRRVLNRIEDTPDMTQETRQTIQAVRDLCKENHIDADQLSDSDRDLCEHYIKIDIFTYPKPIDMAHIDSLANNRR